MHWGRWIIVAFVLFAGFIATLVTVCMHQDVNLVSKDYYQEELVYQDQILRIKNTTTLEQRPVIRKAGDSLRVDFNRFREISHGALTLFRPSDPGLDMVFQLKHTNATQQRFPIHGINKGMYRAKLFWIMHGVEYYMEEIIYI